VAVVFRRLGTAMVTTIAVTIPMKWTAFTSTVQLLSSPVVMVVDAFPSRPDVMASMIVLMAATKVIAVSFTTIPNYA